MSRTDAHRPYHVWIADHPELVVEHHVHTSGSCPMWAGKPLSADNFGGCHVALNPTVRLCGCSLCTGSAWRTVARRALRTAERAYARAAARGADAIELEQLEGRLGSSDVR